MSVTQGFSRLPHCFRSQMADGDSRITQRCGSNFRGLHPGSQVAEVGNPPPRAPHLRKTEGPLE